jgi:hypothetical protein
LADYAYDLINLYNVSVTSLAAQVNAGTIRRPDRLLAAQLYERGVPLIAVENALLLAAARASFATVMRRLSASSALLLTSHRSLMKSSIFKSARITFVICAIRSIDSHEQPKVLTVAPSPEKLPNLSRHAFGVDDVT